MRLGDKGVSSDLENWVKEVLLNVLNFNPRKRPTFNDIKKKADLNLLIHKVEKEHHKRAIESKGNTLLLMS